MFAADWKYKSMIPIPVSNHPYRTSFGNSQPSSVCEVFSDFMTIIMFMLKQVFKCIAHDHLSIEDTAHIRLQNTQNFGLMFLALAESF